MDEALLHKEMYYKELFDAVKVAIYIQDSEGKFIDVNNGALKMYGYSREYFLGKTPEFLSAPGLNDMKQVLDYVHKAYSGEPQEFEFWGIRSNGEIFPKSVTLSKGKYLDQDVIIAVALDITEQKKHEEALKKSEQTYHTLFETSADGMFLMTDVFTECNQAVCTMFNCRKEDIIGQTPARFSPEFQPDGKSSSLSASEKINAALNGIPQRFYWLHKRKDDVLFDAEVSLNSVTIGGKNLVQAMVRDVTERKKTDRIHDTLFIISEAAYTASSMDILYRRIHEAVKNLMPITNIYISLYDEKTGLISFPYFVDEFDPAPGTRPLKRGMTEYVLRTGKAALINEKRFAELKDSGEIEVIGTPPKVWLGVPLKLYDKTIGVIVVQNYESAEAYGENEMQILTFVAEQIAQVIERKRNSDAIKEYSEELKHLNYTKDKFFSIIAHDLKNPFISILGFTELLSSDYHELTDSEKLYYIDELKKTAGISHNLLQNLLLWSRAQTGKIEYDPRKVDIVGIITENIQLHKSLADRKQINLQYNGPSVLTASTDVDMLNVILRNLISNAIKFTNKQGRIIINSFESDGVIKISIEDNGIGMNEETRANLFRLDISHSRPGTDEESGTGLGLILCKEFIERNGGEIGVESQPHKGTKFTFTLPTANNE